jgi:alpha-galactosidase
LHHCKLYKLKFVFLFVCSIISISSQAKTNVIDFKFAKQAMQIEADKSDFTFKISDLRSDNGVYTAVITLDSKVKAHPPLFTIKWNHASIDIAGLWTPVFDNDYEIHADWSSTILDSKLTRNAPAYTLFGHDDVNRFTVAISDAINPVNLSAKVREEDARIYNAIEFFSEQYQKTTHYEVELRIDTRPIAFSQSLAGVADWWATMEQYKPINVPDIATEPMYSTWYSYHQNITHEALLSEAKMAADLGYKAIIVDDGWQTTDSNRGYAYTGDWEPERLKNMKKFVADVHNLDMKALLWYSIPFMGERAKLVDRFKGKYLRHMPSLETYVLDPRFPEVREYLIAQYVKAVRDWKWDGLKLDFIDQFKSDENTILEAVDGRDYASVYEAVDRLMSDMITELKAVNPDVMVEFRQRYIGPAMRKYGNMFRATDIPNGAAKNRQRIVNLRVLSGETAIHSDMLMWHYDEPAEIAALQLLSILYSVPQLSVRLAELPKKHLEMVTYYTKYWKDNKDILLNGTFQPSGIISRYPLISSHKAGKQIVTLYDGLVAEVATSGIKELDIVNAKKSTHVVVKLNKHWKQVKIIVTDSSGRRISEKNVSNENNLLNISVPVSGLASLTKV